MKYIGVTRFQFSSSENSAELQNDENLLLQKLLLRNLLLLKLLLLHYAVHTRSDKS